MAVCEFLLSLGLGLFCPDVEGARPPGPPGPPPIMVENRPVILPPPIFRRHEGLVEVREPEDVVPSPPTGNARAAAPYLIDATDGRVRIRIADVTVVIEGGEPTLTLTRDHLSVQYRGGS
ncbi:hypothetical protein FIV00_03735 [Labrenzia sp. THAF82]|uniref:hypothetical protein n=1 Tax=Labrenzia sp. THAF82 TaxID=2587861 RepID=UPI001268F367|nr:hypothetical protein [Labrenzia sp. THAF82]QFT29581.1 hypothetical protein FIV00_03735 [Labrenzia sp. THAF82]